MNATRWPSLTDFAKHLGRESLCRVEELDKGLHIAWIDNSPENLRRQDAIRKKERQDKGDEEREQALIRDQVARAERDAAEKAMEDDGADEEEARILKREEGEKIKLNFGIKSKEIGPPSTPLSKEEQGTEEMTGPKPDDVTPAQSTPESPALATFTPPPTEKVSLKMGGSSKPKNVFATSGKKNALGGSKPPHKEAPKRPMSEAERIMREEMERKRLRGPNAFSGLNAKRQRTSYG